jgi:hypothetical protein
MVLPPLPPPEHFGIRLAGEAPSFLGSAASGSAGVESAGAGMSSSLVLPPLPPPEHFGIRLAVPRP